MSGIYIHGMEMPKRGHTVTITIVGSGETYVEYYDCKPHVEETIEYKAIPVPPHGDLIDKSGVEVLSWTENPEKDFADGVLFVLDKLDELPVVIPAEEVDK